MLINKSIHLRRACLYSRSIRALVALTCITITLAFGVPTFGYTSGPYAAAQKKEAADASARAFFDGRSFIADEDWAKAAEAFDALISQYPKSEHIEASFYWLAFALKKQSRYKEANTALERLIKQYPESSWLDDARSMRVEIAQKLGNDDVAAEEARKTDNEEIKLAALQSIFHSDPDQGVTLVADIVKPGSQASRSLKESAIILLGQYGGQRAKSLLSDVAGNDPDARIRKTAMLWLGSANEPGILGRLKNTALTTSDNQEGMAALFALSRDGSQRAYEALGEIARGAKSRDLRNEALAWLGRNGEATALDQLMKTYEADSDATTRQEILSIFSRIGAQRAQDHMARIARTTGDKEIRRNAIAFIGMRRGDHTVELLSQLYDGEDDEDLKSEILDELWRSGNKLGLKKLMEAAKSDSSTGLRKKALVLLRQSRDPEVGKFLIELADKQK